MTTTAKVRAITLRTAPRTPTDLRSVTSVGIEVDPRAAGMSPEGVERIWHAVERAYSSGAFPAISLCVRREGLVVIDRAIGHARGGGPGDSPDRPKVAATPDTPYCVFSAAKGVTAALIHILEERGLLRVGDRVAEYLPEFGSHGKDRITIAQVLSHRAGLRTLPVEAWDLDVMADEARLRELLWAMSPETEPGTRQAYHAFTGGFVLAEVVRRVAGKGIRDVLAEQILDPGGFRWTNYGVRAEDVNRVATSYSDPRPPGRLMARHESHMLGRSSADMVAMANDPRFLSLVAPAANTVSTANEMSRFYELLRCEGELDGVRYFEPATLHRALSERSRIEFDRGLRQPIRFSGGFMLGGARVSPFGPDTKRAFGHPGFVYMPAWADPERALSAALLTSSKTITHRGFLDYIRVMGVINREVPKVGH